MSTLKQIPLTAYLISLSNGSLNMVKIELLTSLTTNLLPLWSSPSWKKEMSCQFVGQKPTVHLNSPLCPKHHMYETLVG